MADKTKFKQPGKKTYSVREMLTQERLQTAIRNMISIQRELMETMADDQYKMAEETFDTAIASMVAHMTGVDVREVFREGAASAGEYADSPTLDYGA